MSGTRAWCNRILEGLLAADVRELVVSPGSRSTPLLLAALASPLRLISVIDERSAAFFALGMARSKGLPVALLCTSGSAGAHYLPALLEARYARHRVIAITADRPPQMRQSGANQTIDQQQLFAAACPSCLDLGMPDDLPLALDAVRRRVFESVSLASGPLHFNLPFRKPLEPSETEFSLATESFRPPRLLRPSILSDEGSIQRIQGFCEEAMAIVIVAGPCESGAGAESSAAGLLKLAEATGAVLLAESTSGARLTGETHTLRCDAFPHVLRNEAMANSLTPDLILQFGLEPSCGPLNRWLAKQRCQTFRFCEELPFNSPQGHSEIVFGQLQKLCSRLVDSLQPPTTLDYSERWKKLDQAAWKCAEQVSTKTKTFSETTAMAMFLSEIPAKAQLTLGNSLVVRTADLAAPGEYNHLRVLHQRGTSGIDGLIAGAIGGTSKALSALVLGDVSASHDASSLALAGHIEGPLQILCIDNGGGQIFSHLPVHSLTLEDNDWHNWQTPQQIDWKAICAGYQVAYREAETKEQFSDALQWASGQEGCVFLHVRVDADGVSNFQSRVDLAIVQDQH